MNHIDFYAGEEKYIDLVVRPTDPREIVVVTNAAYELTNQYDDKAVLNGQCEIDGDKISVLLKVIEAGRYELKITFKVGKETRIEKARIEVNA